MLPDHPPTTNRQLQIGNTPAAQWEKVSAEQFWQLYDAAEGGVQVLLALCRLAALRRSDALALKWSNVRFDEGVLVFRPQKVERFLQQDARVPICAELREILEAVRGESLRLDGHVVDRRGITRNFGTLVFPALCRKAKLTPWPKPLHTLRKSCIDDWARHNPPNVVMEWATHSSLATTMKFYAKVSREDEQRGQASMLARPRVG